MSNVSFVLVHKGRKRSPIRASIRYQGITYYVRNVASIETEYFNNGRARGTTEDDIINYRLKKIENAIYEAILFFSKTIQIPSQKEFSRQIENILAGEDLFKSRKKEAEFTPFVEAYIEEVGLPYNTKKGLRTTLNILRKYESSYGRLLFDDITLAFEAKFKRWLLKLGYSRNYIGSIIKRIKRFMKIAETQYKLHKNDEYKLFKVDSETADTIFLTMSELETLHALSPANEQIIECFYDQTKRDFKQSITNIPEDRRAVRLENIRQSLLLSKNKFLIGAICAMRVSDYNRITDTNIKDGIITIVPQKGSSLRKPTPIKMPMHRIIREILASGFDINHKIEEQTLNRHLKILGKIAGFTEPITRYITRGGKLTEETKEKWQMITTHTARRSGATNMFLKGVPVAEIMLCTGHKTLEQTYAYIKCFVDSSVEDLRKREYFSE